jgi:hypothetical protein
VLDVPAPPPPPPSPPLAKYVLSLFIAFILLVCGKM